VDKQRNCTSKAGRWLDALQALQDPVSRDKETMTREISDAQIIGIAHGRFLSWIGDDDELAAHAIIC
jgi:hypothetical protein